jgi:hypothetical protein
MWTAILLIMISLYSGLATADASCQALFDKVSSGFAAAHKMSPLDKRAKCHAYALVTLDMDGIVAACRKPGDTDIIINKFKLLASSLGEDEEKFCSK